MKTVFRLALVACISLGSLISISTQASAQDPGELNPQVAHAPWLGESVQIDDFTYSTSPDECLVNKSDDVNYTSWAGRRLMCGYVNAFGGNARFNAPTGICLAPNGGTYVADSNNQIIRKIDAGRNVTLVVGTPGVTGTMTADVNPMILAVFRYPQGVGGNGSKNFYVLDTENHCIWYVNRNNGNVYLVAGEPGVPGNVNGTGRTARLRQPRRFISINPEGTLLAFEDYGNNQLTKLVRLYPTANGGMTGCVSIQAVPFPCP